MIYEQPAYTRYAVDCPECGEVLDLESDPAGETVECDVCEAAIRVIETR